MKVKDVRANRRKAFSHDPQGEGARVTTELGNLSQAGPTSAGPRLSCSELGSPTWSPQKRGCPEREQRGNRCGPWAGLRSCESVAWVEWHDPVPFRIRARKGTV